MNTSAASSETQSFDANPESMGYVVLLATITAISGFLFGYNTGLINGVLLFLRRQFTPSDLQSEIAASAILVGALLGAAGASMVGDRYGRKKSLTGSAVLFTITPLAAAAANSIALFSVARLFSGLAIGLASVLTPVYIAEIAPSKNRGASKEHIELEASNQLFLTYACNSTQNSDLTNNMNLYRPVVVTQSLPTT